jgi:hypothetical protein
MASREGGEIAFGDSQLIESAIEEQNNNEKRHVKYRRPWGTSVSMLFPVFKHSDEKTA